MNEFERKITKSKNSVNRPMSQSSHLKTNVKFTTAGLHSICDGEKFEKNVKQKNTVRGGRMKVFRMGKKHARGLENYRLLEFLDHDYWFRDLGG